MARGPTGWSFFLGLCLSLATVLAHAVLPVGSPLAPRPGSAFSISTSDVALSRTRRAVPAKPKKQIGAPPTGHRLALPGLDGTSLPAAIEQGIVPAARIGSVTLAGYSRPISTGRLGANRARAPPYA